ncbi:peptide/nickel transport system permease protein [Alkalibacterium subtropicum]|uniref:Peptide/nickel transport system permease protein n=1 Tax=Alkalibacterium subtropicum TaxID=753702 RepID=A0A1I1HG66_9LACT|nr:ABC transporter permease [Alkalibacterium subtropicum]SFC23007.1 peptide/nickel transport system permease protein [Alkalibacterium subtropicum]
MKKEDINKPAAYRFLVSEAYKTASQERHVSWGLKLLSFPFQLLVLIRYLFNKHRDESKRLISIIEHQFEESGESAELKKELLRQEERKTAFLDQSVSRSDIEKNAEHYYQRARQREIKKRIDDQYRKSDIRPQDFLHETTSWLREPLGFLLSIILGFPMYLLLWVVSVPVIRYVANRLVAMLFVIVGVTVIVFTLLHLSPSDAALNILGEQATPQQVENFNQVHGLNDPYVVQLWRTVKGVFTFDLGISFEGNERVVATIMRRFPVTLQLAFFALMFSVTVALPSGIYAAVKANTTFDHLFMFIALIGISIPSFWQGLIFILTFSINLGWLPATYSASNLASLIMPAVVLGTALMASVARMTRSSTLEVINEDYILTARAKGLSSKRVILRHAVPNALIPVITIIGLQFSAMLGGAAVTEQVFNIRGLGSYIVNKQFVPDIPSVMGGVIYIAIALSIVNLIVDLIYSFLDPRIRSRIKNSQ